MIHPQARTRWLSQRLQVLRLGYHPREIRQPGHVRIRSVTHSLVQRIDACNFVNAEFEVEDVEVLHLRAGLVDFGMAERPSCRCQRSMTWAGLFAWVCAIARIEGSSITFFLRFSPKPG